MATPKRPPESSADDDGFLPVRRKRQKKLDAPETPAARGTPMFWRIAEHKLDSPYSVVTWLEDELKLLLRVEVSRTGDFFIRGADWGHAATLQEVAAGQPRGIVLLPREVTRKCVLQGYPTALPLDP